MTPMVGDLRVEQGSERLPLLVRHKVQVLLEAGHAQRCVADLAGVSPATVRRVQREVAVTDVDDGARVVVPENLSAPVPENLSAPERRNQNDAEILHAPLRVSGHAGTAPASVRSKHLPADEAVGEDARSDEVLRLSGKKVSEFPEPPAACLARCERATCARTRAGRRT
ncbi:MAG: hypothetical protein IT374_12030 [Polyangiaceae bacterium]|nr:hypothetical protein [Polyangiaceae bacterium]